MYRQYHFAMIMVLLLPLPCAADAIDELQSQVEILARQVRDLQEQIRQIQYASEVHAEAENEDTHDNSSLVDLNPQQRLSIDDSKGMNVLESPWWRNFDISGFGAVGFYDTGSAGTRDDGGFEIREASLFVTTEVWDDIEFFLELQTNRLDKDDALFARTGEVYVHLRDILQIGSSSIGMKIGRIDIPFGEEYLWQDAIDNPLITNSAAYPYGWDEGVLFYGNVGSVGWIASITDGTNARSQEDNSDKAFNIKVHGSPMTAIDLSLSLMSNGAAAKSAIEFGGSHFEPIGVSQQSTLGTSVDSAVEADLFEISAKYAFDISGFPGYLALSAGGASTQDDDPTFNRDMRWISVEPYFRLSDSWYAVLRYSEIDTDENDEGYHFDGKTFAGGNSAFGYDTQSLRRFSVGLGWTPNPHVRGKLEISRDRFKLIDASPLLPRNSDRNFVGLEMAVGF